MGRASAAAALGGGGMLSRNRSGAGRGPPRTPSPAAPGTIGAKPRSESTEAPEAAALECPAAWLREAAPSLDLRDEQIRGATRHWMSEDRDARPPLCALQPQAEPPCAVAGGT